MRLFLYISDFIVPFMILSILIYGIFAGVKYMILLFREQSVDFGRSCG